MGKPKRFYIQNKVHDWLEGREFGNVVTTEDAAKGLVREQPEFMREAYVYWQEAQPFYMGEVITFEQWFGRNVQRAMKTADREGIVMQVGPMKRRLKTAFQITGRPFQMAVPADDTLELTADSDTEFQVAVGPYGAIEARQEPALLDQGQAAGTTTVTQEAIKAIASRTMTFEVLAEIDGGYLLRGKAGAILKALVV